MQITYFIEEPLSELLGHALGIQVLISASEVTL